MKVLISGTFDILHSGHVEYINEASSLGEVHVIVACDSNCLSRGKKPVFTEDERVKLIESIKGVHRVYLGREDNDHQAMVNEIQPDLILLGYDQSYTPTFSGIPIVRATRVIQGVSSSEIRKRI